MLDSKELEQWITSQGIPGAAITRVNAYGKIESCAAGICSSKDSSPHRVTVDTSFQLASVSKFMTACLVVELSKQGKIKLNEQMSWQPYRGSSASTTTFADLLSHRGGFSKNIGFPCATENILGYQSQTKADVVCGKYYQENMRGIYVYSGCNYWLVQRLLEQRMQDSFDSLLQTWICQPFSLSHTSCKVTNSASQCVAYGHDDAGQIDGGWCRFEGVEAAAGIWSTANDLGQLLKQLMDRTNNSSARRAMLKISDLFIQGQGNGYHYGVMVNQRLGGLTLSHHGINPGYQAMIRIDLDASVASAAMINGEHCNSLLKILTLGPGR